MRPPCALPVAAGTSCACLPCWPQRQLSGSAVSVRSATALCVPSLLFPREACAKHASQPLTAPRLEISACYPLTATAPAQPPPLSRAQHASHPLNTPRMRRLPSFTPPA